MSIDYKATNLNTNSQAGSGITDHTVEQNDLITRWDNMNPKAKDHFLSEVAVMESAKTPIFSQLGNKSILKKGYGETLKKLRYYPAFHEKNTIDVGLNANAAVLLKNVFFAYDKNGSLIGNANGYKTQALAQAVVDAETADANGFKGKVESGAGQIMNGTADYNTIKDKFPTLSEVGGNVNAINCKAEELTANVSEFGLHTKFTQKSIDMDSTSLRILSLKSKWLGAAKAEVYEKQVQCDLFAAALNNIRYAGNANSKSTIGVDDIVDYRDLRAFKADLQKAKVPVNTKMITGSNKYGTKTIAKAYYAYVPTELVATLEDMVRTPGQSDYLWEHVDSYADGARGNVAEGEIGRIGSFRFIEVVDFLSLQGEGATIDAADDLDGMTEEEIEAGTEVANSGAVYSSTVGANEKVDIFPILVVGSDSFETIGFEGSSSKVVTAMPKPDAYNDPFGKVGSMAVSWFHGTLVYKSERIRTILTAAKY